MYDLLQSKRKRHESMRLVAMADAVFLIAKLEHSPLPVSFKLTQFSDSTAVFENPAHDFPTRIVYHLSN